MKYVKQRHERTEIDKRESIKGIKQRETKGDDTRETAINRYCKVKKNTVKGYITKKAML